MKKLYAFAVLISLMTQTQSAKFNSSDKLNVNCCADGFILEYNDAHYCRNPKDNSDWDAKDLNCSNNTQLFTRSHLAFRINSYNQLEMAIRMGFWEVSLQPHEYCVGTQLLEDNVTEVEAFVSCEEPIEEQNASFLPYCMMVSVVFLFLTAIIYTAISELRDLQGKSIISFCVSLGTALLFLIVMELVEYEDFDLCTARGFFAYYFIIATFFWMNAISIQIFKSVRNTSMNTYRWRDYMWYGIYAWGSPALLTILLVILNYAPGNHKRPGIGLNSCFFYDSHRQWLYLYSVMTILLVANFIIFIYIMILLCRNSFSSTHVKSLRYKFFMTLKLTIVMGLPWIFEMINTSMPQMLFTIVLDAFNTLQGIFIFLVLVVFRVRVIKALHRNNLLCCMSNFVEKRLATRDDEEEEIVHTIAVPLEETNGLKPEIIRMQ